MKKLLTIYTIVGLIMAVTILASGSNLGSVKTALRERLDTADRFGIGPEVGWTIANVDAEGLLIVNIHMANGMPDMTFTVWIVINNEWIVRDLGELTTNRKGRGNAYFELQLSKYPPDGTTAEMVDVRVVVDNWYPGDRPWPYIGYATSENEVPLKKSEG